MKEHKYIYVKDKFIHITETKISIQSLLVKECIAVDFRAYLCRPSVHFDRLESMMIIQDMTCPGRITTTFLSIHFSNLLYLPWNTMEK